MESEDCIVCPHFSLCHGGCPGRTFTAKGTLFAKDPHCDVYKAVFAKARELAGKALVKQADVPLPVWQTGSGTYPALGVWEEDPMITTKTETRNSQPTGRMPVVFAAHGAPVLLDDAAWMGELASWAKAMPRPESILMVSAHWEERPATLGATRPVPLVYDFYGFPEKYYETRYDAPCAPGLAARVRELLGRKEIGVADAPERGLDHGAYVPLVAMYPGADVPVLQLSIPGLDAKELFALGRALAPLRDEGVLVFGSGFLTHNMRYAFRPGTPQWARDFDAWAADALARFDVDALMDFEKRAPAARTALPTWEHFAPLLVAAGAAGDAPTRTSFPITGWWMDGAFTKRSVQLD